MMLSRWIWDNLVLSQVQVLDFARQPTWRNPRVSWCTSDPLYKGQYALFLWVVEFKGVHVKVFCKYGVIGFWKCAHSLSKFYYVCMYIGTSFLWISLWNSMSYLPLQPLFIMYACGSWQCGLKLVLFSVSVWRYCSCQGWNYRFKPTFSWIPFVRQDKQPLVQSLLFSLFKNFKRKMSIITW